MERNFKKEIQEAASNPIDMADMMAQLVQVRKGHGVLEGITGSPFHFSIEISLLSGIRLTGLIETVVERRKRNRAFLYKKIIYVPEILWFVFESHLYCLIQHHH